MFYQCSLIVSIKKNLIESVEPNDEDIEFYINNKTIEEQINDFKFEAENFSNYNENYCSNIDESYKN